jgi:coenzyme F420-reducing hydrogenase gamma subunit
MKTLTNFLHISLFILIFLLMGSCNPVKIVLNNNQKFEKVAKEVVKRGYCINDTVIVDVVKIDTIIQNNYITDTISITTKDTVLPSGTSISVKNDKVYVKCPPTKNIIQTVTKNNYIRDVKLESILKTENTQKTDSIKELKIDIKDKKVTIVKERARFYILLSMIAISVILYVINKFKKLY